MKCDAAFGHEDAGADLEYEWMLPLDRAREMKKIRRTDEGKRRASALPPTSSSGRRMNVGDAVGLEPARTIRAPWLESGPKLRGAQKPLKRGGETAEGIGAFDKQLAFFVQTASGARIHSG